MNNTLYKLGLIFMLASCAPGAQARTDGQEAVSAVGERIRAGDCEAVVKRLNAGLGAGYPEVALLAGNLFEVGACVRKDWDKAVHFYSLAHEGGMKEGAWRLAAGFAADEHGPDRAAALWWARRAGLDADRCTADLPKTDDPDPFVEALRTWPAQRLAVCNYVVGVMAFVAAEAHYPIAGVSREVAGRVEVDYWPALFKFSTKAPGATVPAQYGMGEVIAKAESLAGARYRKPAGIDPAWVIPFVLVVDTEKGKWW